MNEQEKQEYLEKYQQAKKKGVPFYPDIIFKDAVVSLLIFLVLIALAYFVGAPLEERANPADTSYTPKPEWYFLFLFQLLKYFPGQLEVIGVVVLPTIVILLFLALPFLDRSTLRHYANRKLVVGGSSLLMLGIVALTVMALIEAPPPGDETFGDQTAALYARNCASCHGAVINVASGSNLHEIIAAGQHEGMPAWSADLTTDEIDALAGFILSPGGSTLFTSYCGACHSATDLVGADPLMLRDVLDLGADFTAHVGIEIPDFAASITSQERTELLNFLVAPDGQRLFTVNCSVCHGRAVGFSGEREELRSLIAQGGLHLEMPPWRQQLSQDQINTLASYVVSPSSTPAGAALFSTYCSSCHGSLIPTAADVPTAGEIIASGGTHQTMPIWGSILTAEQLEALTSYTLDAARGTPLQLGQRAYQQYCAICHGDFGEGGLNPARAGDVIAPISSAEYLKTRDDSTLRAIISQGQPNFGMSPFGSAFGGPLDDDEIDAILAFMRSWEANPPVELAPEFAATPIQISGEDVYQSVCSQCHGTDGEGITGPSLRDPVFQASLSDEELFSTISDGHPATSMIAWGSILTSEQISQLVTFIRQWTVGEAATGSPSFARDVMPIFRASCTACHGMMGGWDATTYSGVMTSGVNAPSVIPGDAAASPLIQRMQGSSGGLMPPAGKLADERIQLIIDWINAGAPNN